MQRRSFIHLSAFTTAALVMPFVNGCSYNQLNTEARPLFFSRLTDIKTILQIGEDYRKTHPTENNKNKLSELLLADAGLKTTTNDSTTRFMLDNCVMNDFKTGKIITIKGWVLSITEARQCALFSILQS